VAYELRGQFLEACDCRVTCPCWFHEQPDDDECTGLVAWQVEWGRIDGVDVAGLTVVSVSHHGGHRAEGHARVALFIDERAGEEQRAALAAAFSGKLGGPLRELAEITRSVERLEPAPIRFASNGATTSLVVGDVAQTEMTPLTASTERIITVVDGALGNVLSPVAEVGRSNYFWLDIGDARRDDARRSASRGRFQYRHGIPE
jgi:hypothetical protein